MTTEVLTKDGRDWTLEYIKPEFIKAIYIKPDGKEYVIFASNKKDIETAIEEAEILE